MHCTGAATMALDDLLATLERQCGTPGTSGVLADVPAKPAPALGGTSGTSGTSENGEGEVQAEAFTVWALHFTDRESAEVHFSPAATLAEVLTAYPAAVAAEPARQRESGTEDRGTPAPPPSKRSRGLLPDLPTPEAARPVGWALRRAGRSAAGLHRWAPASTPAGRPRRELHHLGGITMKLSILRIATKAAGEG